MKRMNPMMIKINNINRNNNQIMIYKVIILLNLQINTN